MDAEILNGNIKCPFHGMITPEECGKLKNSDRCEDCFIFKAVSDEGVEFDSPKEMQKDSVN